MFKNTDIWFLSYLKHEIKRRLIRPKKPTHIMFCFVDHYEPEWNGADLIKQKERVQTWMDRYPILAKKHQDADGCYPKHSFFYPVEVYEKDPLNQLADLCQKGFGEVEIHLHHNNDTEQGLRDQLEQAKKDLSSHGLLGRDQKTGDIRYAFIHGNWALNNSRPDGQWCGVNNESQILVETGCYADFTFPSAPSDTQPKKINSIYYDIGNSHIPKSHNTGLDVQVGMPCEEKLMIIQGPLTLNWGNRKVGIFPRIENSDITGINPATKNRVDLWIQQHISIENKPDWMFIKLHTHGAQEKNMESLLGESADEMYSYLESQYNDGKNFILHYVSAREMYNIIKATESGEKDSPEKYRDYKIVLP